MVYSFSERTRYLRFHGAVKAFPHTRLQVFCNVDYNEEMALIGTIGEPGAEEVIAVGRYLRDAANNTAEVAFVVRDDWQNKGLGKLVFRKLIEVGRQRGIAQFWAEVLAENIPMLKVFHHSDCEFATKTEGDVVHVTVDLSPQPTTPQTPQSPAD
jgi:GNAT superfamily N-acetyltransferase